ncbi:uncharacterized protein LOC119337164 isoform X2 [Triticum dicoccoides]|uniref:uncharacterized protein LOC119337164 isoform X2 n=1 Tax=Triticum dicoccoides TaxID=85692 RepID=UPI001891E09E|nr:uncharacterized protein LOC119337164 isoform X2 [Triticum dicoccoides]
MDRQIELENILLYEDLEPRALSYQLLKKITKDFSDMLEIGRGGFAVVYKAILDNGVVAVKRLSSTYMHEEMFQGEVKCLMKAKHKNIVRFLGYCSDTQGNMEIYEGKWVMGDLQKRLLCFEYLPKGSLDHYIKYIGWTKCYNIIKGVCEGLNYLHEKNIMHLDLKPGNILLDEDMMPKISDFGQSRCFEEDQTRVTTKHVAGTRGYIPPECLSGEKVTITHKFDLYSLGAIIKEMLTGEKGQITIENVLEIWSDTKLDALQWEQIRECAMIGIECTDFDQAKRPASVKHIINRLAEIECTMQIPEYETSELLLLQQFTLCFPFEPNKVITCPLPLTNNTDNLVAFRLMDKSMESSFLRLPLYGLVQPNTPYTLMVTTRQKEELPRKRIADVILHIGTLILGDDKHINTFQGEPDKFFQEMGDAVREVKLKALYTQRQYKATSPSKPVSPAVKIIPKIEGVGQYSLDTNQAKPWIMIGEENGYIRFWDYQTQKRVNSLKVQATKVRCVRFMEREKWIVAGTEDGYVHVYSYEPEIQYIKSFSVTDDVGKKLSIGGPTVMNLTYQSLCLLAVHPTHPYLLSGDRNYMQLWYCDKDWECVLTYCVQNVVLTPLMEITDATFNTNGTFATASTRTHGRSSPTKEYTVEVWSFKSPKSICTLRGHSKSVNCLAFFTCHDQEFLVTGSDDHTAKIWYLQKEICAHTLEASVSPVRSALYQPNVQTLIIGTEDGAIYLWSTINCRTYSCPPTLSRIINIGCDGAVYHLARAMGSIVIGKGNTIAIMEFDNTNYQEQSSDYNKQQLTADTRQHSRHTTYKETTGSMNKLPILHVEAIKLCFPFLPNQPIPCPLDLRNNTDEKYKVNQESSDLSVLQESKFTGFISKLPMLHVQPLELCFPYHPNESISCSLGLTNNTNENMAFRLVDKSGKSPWCFTKMPLYGIVPGRSTYTLIVTTKEEMKLEEQTDFDLVIQSSLSGDEFRMVFGNQSESNRFFEEAKESGKMVHEVILKAVYLQYEEMTFEDQNISVNYNLDDLWSIDAHPTEPWILTGHRSGYAIVWDHEMKFPVNSFKVSEHGVSLVKFIARKELILAGTRDGCLHMYDCACVTKIEKIHETGDPILAVHPSLTRVLFVSLISVIVLVDWDLGWKQKQIFWATPDLSTAAFNPEDDTSFVGGFKHGELQVWKLDSKNSEYSLTGHSGIVNCVGFIRCGDQHNLVSGSMDCTAKIWDLKKRECIHTLQALSPVRCVLAHSNSPILITGTEHGLIHVWSSTDFRLKRTINLGGGGPVIGLACLMDTQRVVIGQNNAMSSMEILSDGSIPKRETFSTPDPTWLPTNATDLLRAHYRGQRRQEKKGKQPDTVSLSTVEQTQPWSPPHVGWLKVNVDGVFDGHSGTGGVGIVVRDHQGAIVLTSWSWIKQATGPEQVESVACREGLRLAAEWTRLPIVLESGCLSIVNCLKSSEVPYPEDAFILREAQHFREVLPELDYCHGRREQNMVAHELAQLAKRTKHSAVWHRVAPTCVVKLVAHDSNFGHDR